jgi:hypothetical protein
MLTRKFPIASLRENIQHPIDVFVCCGSFEERSLSIAREVDPAEITHALVVENKNLSRYVGKNSGWLRSRFGEKSIDVATDSTNPIITADNIQNAIKAIFQEKSPTVLVDITTLRHESLLILLNLLRIHAKSGRIFLAYTAAADYSVGDEPEKKWLSKGLSQVRAVLGYAGVISPSRKMHLIVLVGFEHQRASKLIETLEPGIISLGYGAVGTSTEDKHLASQTFFYRLLQTMMAIHGNVEGFEFACNDPIKTKDSIQLQKAKYLNYNTVIAPMNTKLSTVGAAFSAFDDASIQICYAEPSQYNIASYSSPGLNCYLFELSLGGPRVSGVHS